MKKLALLFAAAALCAPRGLAADYLEPERSIIDSGTEQWGALNSEYARQIVHVLHRAYQEDVLLRVVITPSFHSEAAIGVSEKDGEYRIFSLSSPAPICCYKSFIEEQLSKVDANGKPIIRDFSTYPPDPADMVAKGCEVIVAPELGKRIANIWRLMLSEARFPDRPNSNTILDGISYYFSMREDFRVGGAWHYSSPYEPSSKTEMLTAIVSTMAQYCDNKDQKVVAKLDAQVDALSKKFQ